jgi:hypothetical protein
LKSDALRNVTLKSVCWVIQVCVFIKYFMKTPKFECEIIVALYYTVNQRFN